MRLIRTWREIQAEAAGAVVAVGNFDGVHEGHRAVIGAAVGAARTASAPAGVLTFEPHPRTWFRPEQDPFRLTPLRSKVRQLEAQGLDLLYVLPFDEAMATRTAEAFVEDILIGGLQADRVVVGYDFVFGKGRTGSVETLQGYSEAGRFGLTVVPAVDDGTGASYSSTRIRGALRDGDPATAAALLGRYWEIEGHVLPGDRRGRTIGFPTANLDIGDYLRPRFGVYAVLIALDDPDSAETVWLPGVANLGKRPTIGGDKVLLEVNIFDFDSDIYGRLARVRLVDYVRPETKFDGLDALKAQIAKDAAAARRIIAALPAGRR
ncbi:MAG: bifunctional riboflavin kinase/FAD synthetase [Rhodospirillaceae bacterium]|nr:bifunctional riboflavin kinase/FAD synthetase [Rhodospirillaceae bacterium]